MQAQASSSSSAQPNSSRWALTSAIAFGVGVYYLWKFFENLNPSSNDFPISEVESVMSRLDLPSPMLSEGHRMTYPPDIVSDTTCSATGTYVRSSRGAARARMLKAQSGGLDTSFSGNDLGATVPALTVPTVPASSTRAPAVAPILIIYGSESGTAKGSALALARELRLRGSAEVEVLDPSTLKYSNTTFPGWDAFGVTGSIQPSSAVLTPIAPVSPSSPCSREGARPTATIGKVEEKTDWDCTLDLLSNTDDGGEAKSFDDVFPLPNGSRSLPRFGITNGLESVADKVLTTPSPQPIDKRALATAASNTNLLGIGLPLETFCEGVFNRRTVIIFIVATYGEGGPCANYKSMHEALSAAAAAADRIPAASSLFCDTNVAVFGYGSSAYKNYCQNGKGTAENLLRLGATMLTPLTCADAHSTAKRPMDDLFDEWQESLVSAMEHLDEKHRTEMRDWQRANRGAGGIVPAHSTLLPSRTADGEHIVPQMVPTAIAKLRLDDDADTTIFPAPSSASIPTAKRPLKCPVLGKRRLIAELQQKVEMPAVSEVVSQRNSAEGGGPSTLNNSRIVSYNGSFSAVGGSSFATTPIVGSNSSGELLYMSFDVSHSKGLEYQAGDHLSIYARNDPKIATAVLELVLYRHLQLPLGDQEKFVAAWFAGAGPDSMASNDKKLTDTKRVSNNSIAIGEPAAASSSLFRNKNIKQPKHYFGSREGRKEIASKAVTLEAPSLNKARASGHSTFPCRVSLQHVFEWYLDLSGPPKKSMLRTLARCCRDPSERADFMSAIRTSSAPQNIANSVHPAPLKRLYDYLHQYPSCVVPLDLFLECCPRIQPRRYSIASDSLRYPTEVHIIAKVVPNGLATRYLEHDVAAVVDGTRTRDLESLLTSMSANDSHHNSTSNVAGPQSMRVTPPQSLGTRSGGTTAGGTTASLLLSPAATANASLVDDHVYAFVSHSDFHLPPTKSLKTKSILMIGPGTGIAPLLGFIHRRLAIGLNGGKDRIPPAKREGYLLEVAASEVAASMKRHAKNYEDAASPATVLEPPCHLYVGCRDFDMDCAVRALFDSDALMLQQLGQLSTQTSTDSHIGSLLALDGNTCISTLPRGAVPPLSLPIKVAISRGRIPLIDPLSGTVTPSTRQGKKVLAVDTIPNIWSFGRGRSDTDDLAAISSISLNDRSPAISPHTAAPTPAGVSAEDIVGLTTALLSKSSMPRSTAASPKDATTAASYYTPTSRSVSPSNSIQYPIASSRLPTMVPSTGPLTNQNNYVQSLLEQNAEEVLEHYLYNPNGFIYICGDALRMAKDVRETFIRLLMRGTAASQSEAGGSRADAEAHLALMEKQGRYLQDIW